MMAFDQARFAVLRVDGGAGHRRAGSVPGSWLCALAAAAQVGKRDGDITCSLNLIASSSTWAK